MVSVFRYHEISESSHRIMNPPSVDKLLLIGDTCRIGKGTRLLDLACGKGEMLCLFARDLGASGVALVSDQQSCLRLNRHACCLASLDLVFQLFPEMQVTKKRLH